MKRLIPVLLTLVLACSTLVAQRAPVPAATGPMLDIANKLVESINRQDADSLNKMVAPDAVYLDEDGHALRVGYWIRALTTGTPAKKIEISQIHGEAWDTAGWISFNYTIAESFQGAPRAVRGTASIFLKKAAGAADWQIVVIHGALEQSVAGITQ